VISQTWEATTATRMNIDRIVSNTIFSYHTHPQISALAQD